MSGDAAAEHLWIIGAGRVGLALGLLLARSGRFGPIAVSGRRPETPDHPLFVGPSAPARYTTLAAAPPAPLAGVLLAVPDAALPEAAAWLAARGLPAGTPVLHLSGARGADALHAVSAAGLAAGALHPLAAVADPVDGADRLRGVWWGVEAAGAALGVAERIVAAAEGRVLRVDPGAKPLYHAAAVFASNYVVALLGEAARMMERAGADPGDARAALAALAAGAVDNVGGRGAAAALTGPVARGDAETVRLHLSRLSSEERALYFPLAGAALRLARERGLDEGSAARIQRTLEEER